MKFIPALDGVRGIAILAVMLFHIGFLNSGWAGVQLFFVLSGFLITSILRSDKALPLASYLKRFYWRRTLRIFPLYYAFLFGLVVIFAIAGATAAFRQQWPYLSTYTFNFARMLDGYAYPRFWGHFWSLSIEEQFYVLWPTFVYFMPARWFRPALAGLILGTPILRFVLGHHLAAMGAEPTVISNYVYNLTFCQLDSFAFGAWIATEKVPQKSAHRQFALATVVLLASGLWNAWSLWPVQKFTMDTFGYPVNTPFNFQYVWGDSLLNLWSACLIGSALHLSPIARFLEFRPLVYTGKISYGLYIFHVPVLALLYDYTRLSYFSRSLPGVLALFVYLAATYAVSHLSFHLFERKFLALKDRFFASTRTALPSTP